MTAELKELEVPSELSARMEEYWYRYFILRKNFKPDGCIEVDLKEESRSPRVRIEDFLSFAGVKKWDIPEKFSLLGASGIVIKLPWRTRKLEVFKAELEKFGLNYLENPELITSTKMALAYDEVVLEKPKAEGEKPSSTAWSVASFFSPFDDKTKNLRNRKKN